MTLPLRALLALLATTPSLALAAPAARVVLKDAKGETVGTATLTQEKEGVLVAVQVAGLPPGEHGFHLHAAGKCDPPSFLSAGPHFNPGGKQHGFENPMGFHAGDLPNLTVGPDGKGKAEAVAKGVTLGTGKDGLFHEGGTALVVHEKADDMKTDPAGNSGGRIACGVVEKPK
jgi:Cu-Zn family superoxide dismutase